VSDENSDEIENGVEKDFERRINLTFKSILYINWILVVMGVIMFSAAIASAVGLLRLDIALLLSVTGFGDIYTVFKFAMNRLQRNLGDQVQVQTACDGYTKQIERIGNFKSDAELTDIKTVNDEIRKTASYSMELIQNFTEIGKPIEKEPWISSFPIRYEEFLFPSEVKVGDEITASGTLRNVGDKPNRLNSIVKRQKPIRLTSIVIAVRPPYGTPSGGPFRFDFKIDPARVLKPGESYTIKHTKRIDDNVKSGTKEDIPDRYFDEDWAAFMTCQTEDGFWHDDPNKTSFRVLKK